MGDIVMNQWIVDPKGTCEDHWVDLMYVDEETGCWKYASVKWDGCIHFSQAGNVPYGEEFGTPNTERNEASCDDGMHICDIDELIDVLQSLKIKAQKHFKNRGAW
jgi:hypothetical protein